MDVIELGQRAKAVRVVLTRYGFSAVMRIRPGGAMATWPDGTVVELHLAAKDGRTWTWPATVVADTITWNVSPSATAPVPQGADAVVVVTLPGRPPVEWYDGGVVRP